MIDGVRDSPPAAPARHLAAASDQIPEQGRLVLDIGETTIGIFRVGGRLFAYVNSCPHMGGPVCQGLTIPAVREVVGDDRVSRGCTFDESELRIVCPWHGYEFAIETGSHPAKPSIRLTSVAVEEADGEVYVTL
jgi:nitrite reductase/ring-hydroxylating ferredoxin subunit